MSETYELANPEKQKVFIRFFKTGVGQYGEGDQFLGLTVPQQRILAKKYQHLSLNDVETLLKNPIHELRLIALIILTHHFQKKVGGQKNIVDFYLDHTKWINNWDLVDVSAYKILGEYLHAHDTGASVLYRLALSTHLWERRIAMVSTFAFIRDNQLTHTFALSKVLLHDTHDLIHKAVGWMLREAGKRDQKQLKQFLNTYAAVMSRTTLRYAIEKFPESVRKHYLSLRFKL
ncbi:MAG: DNA alkylation repair protein [Candidatus Roizmanbacteria bacterium]|nr:DNA alkylation repair protein [Candidatus Roizmanbacteria bacterium]